MKVSSILTYGATILYLWLIFWFQKWNAVWWDNVNVLIFSVILAPTLAFGFKLLIDKWLLDPWGGYRYPNKYFYLLFLGLGISTILGVTVAEPKWESTTPVVHKEKAYSPGVYYNRYYYSSPRARSGEVYVPSLDFLGDMDAGEDGGEALAFLLLLILVLILVIGSAFITHFWVFSGLLMLSLMWLYYHSNSKQWD